MRDVPRKSGLRGARAREILLSALLALSPFVAVGSAVAVEELCGNGFDDDTSGYTKGACPSGWMDSVYGDGCDLKCPILDDGCRDDDNDGYPTCGTLAEFARGSAVVDGAQTTTAEITVEPGHDITPGKYVTFYDSVSAGTVSREVLGARYNSITIAGATVTVADGAAINAVAVVDCDDSDRRMWPGKYETCGTDGTRLCQSDGTFTGCSEGELCEATGSGDCYYIDPVSGSNANNGLTRATAWANQKMFAYYGSGAESTPSGHHTPVAGDVFYLMGGTHDTTYNGGTGGEAGRWLTLRGSDCTRTAPCKIKAYPGEVPIVIDSDITYGDMGIHIYQSDWWLLEGFEIDGEGVGEGAGILLFQEGAASGSMEIRDVICHDRAGSRDNLACMRSTNDEDASYSFRHNVVYDTNGTSGVGKDTEIGIWKGANHVNFNVIFNSATMPSASDLTNHCIFWKHASYTSSLHMAGNTMWNCGDSDSSIGFAGPYAIIRFNRLIDSDFIEFADLGGPTHQHDISMSNNTFKDGISTGSLIGISFQRGYNEDGSAPADACSGSDIENVAFSKNMVTGAASDVVVISEFQSDLIYADVVTQAEFSMTDNAYDNGGTANFCLFCSNNGVTTCAGRGNNGSDYTLATLQSSGLIGAEASSRSGATTWNEFQQSTAAADCHRGWRTNCRLASGPGRSIINVRGRLR